MSEHKRRELLLQALAEEGAARCGYAPGCGNPLAWPNARCDCKYVGHGIAAPSGEHTGCCEIRAAYRVVRDALDD